MSLVAARFDIHPLVHDDIAFAIVNSLLRRLLVFESDKRKPFALTSVWMHLQLNQIDFTELHEMVSQMGFLAIAIQPANEDFSVIVLMLVLVPETDRFN